MSQPKLDTPTWYAPQVTHSNPKDAASVAPLLPPNDTPINCRLFRPAAAQVYGPLRWEPATSDLKSQI
jgi:hypothetical protein